MTCFFLFIGYKYYHFSSPVSPWSSPLSPHNVVVVPFEGVVFMLKSLNLSPFCIVSLLIVVSGILSFTDRVVFKEEVVFRNDIFVCVRFLWFWLISQYSFPLTTVIFPSGPTCFVKVGFHVYLAPSPCTSHTPPLACTHFFPPCCQGGWSSCFSPTILRQHPWTSILDRLRQPH